MTKLRNEFGFSEWLDHWLATEERAQYDMFPRSDEAWHAAIDAVRAALVRKEFWIAPITPDTDMLEAAYNSQGEATTPAIEAAWDAMRDSYIAYYGQDFGLDP